MTELNNNTFHEAIASPTAILVDFWAPWCGPCRVLGPVLEELSEEMTGKADFCKINIDDHSELAQEFDVTSIPTLIIFKDGIAIDRLVGVRPKDEIKEAIEKHI